MPFTFSRRSRRRLEGVHQDLQKVARLALDLTPLDFGVTEGLRDIERQRELVAKGASRTMRSRHLTGHAIDIVVYKDGEVTWSLPDYKIVADAFKEAARRLAVPIIWGGDWRSFKDGPHFELDRKVYP